jgi:hypothetical protein
MNKQQQRWRWIAFLLTFVAVGVPYWLIPYNTINLPDALLSPGLWIAFFATLILRSYAGARFWKATLTIAAAVPAAVFARVIVDCAHDPTAHNLWPFEIIIACLVGFVCALAGALAGTLVRFAVGRLSGP